MLEPMTIITNNPLTRDFISKQNDCELCYMPVTYREVLLFARDAVHEGRRLLTHPLSGSIKPGETPYKSLALSKEAGNLDVDSLELIENCILTCDKFPLKHQGLSQKCLMDFQVVDLTLIQSIF